MDEYEKAELTKAELATAAVAAVAKLSWQLSAEANQKKAKEEMNKRKKAEDVLKKEAEEGAGALTKAELATAETNQKKAKEEMNKPYSYSRKCTLDEYEKAKRTHG